jgi:hypothetical protein
MDTRKYDGHHKIKLFDAATICYQETTKKVWKHLAYPNLLYQKEQVAQLKTKNSINKKLKIGLPNRTQGQGDDDLLSPNQGMYNHQYNNYVIYNCNITKY